MEYTKEKLASAFSSVNESLTWEELIDKLEKPKPVFKVGEVVMSANLGPIQWHPDYHTEHRHLNLTENPSTALAIERFERLADDNNNFVGVRNFAQQALVDIKKMVG